MHVHALNVYNKHTIQEHLTSNERRDIPLLVLDTPHYTAVVCGQRALSSIHAVQHMKACSRAIAVGGHTRQAL